MPGLILTKPSALAMLSEILIFALGENAISVKCKL